MNREDLIKKRIEMLDSMKSIVDKKGNLYFDPTWLAKHIGLDEQSIYEEKIKERKRKMKSILKNE